LSTTSDKAAAQIKGKIGGRNLPLVHQCKVYADYGTFVLAPHDEMGFEFPTSVTDDDIKSGFRIVESGLVIYTPDLDDFSIDVEVYLGNESDQGPAPQVAFSTPFVIDAVSLCVCGLMEKMADKPAFSIAAGSYECVGKGHFSEGRNLYQLFLTK
jgi:hypothetical protein